MQYLDDAPCGYFSFTADGKVQQVNRSFCDLLGYREEELVGDNVGKFLTISSKIFYQTHLFPLLQMQGFAEEIFLMLRMSDGNHLPVLLNAKKVISESGTYYTSAFIPVHNRKKFEDELVAAKKQAEKALADNSLLMKVKEELQQYAEQLDEQLNLSSQQNEELVQYNRVVTHELQEPLRKILLFSKMLSDNPQLHHLEGKNLHRLFRAAEQLKIIVSGLQKFVWLQEAAFSFESTNLNDVVSAVVSQLNEEGHHEKFDVVIEKLPVVHVDAEQFRLLFFHLFSNCVRFRKDGQRVTINVTSTVIERNRFKSVLNKYKYDEFIKLDVTDDGAGFDPLYKEQVTELFKRLHSNEGRGIGLALCKKIVENHAGVLAIDSSPGVGTTVTIMLPLHHASKKMLPQIEEVTNPPGNLPEIRN